MRASRESRPVGPKPGGARSAGGAPPRARRRIRERSPDPRGPLSARKPEHLLVLPEEGPLLRPRTAYVTFDRSGKGLAHGPIPGDVRMETVRAARQAVRIPGIRVGC